MNIVFEVIPGAGEVPTFRVLTAHCLAAYVEKARLLYGANASFNPKIDLTMKNEDSDKFISLDDTAIWHQDHRLMFKIAGPDSAAMYCREINDSVRSLWLGDLADSAQGRSLENRIRACLHNNHYWRVECAVGSSTMRLSAGLMAISLAQLTKGVISSDDLAWGPNRYPASGEESFTWYFDPSGTLMRDYIQ